MQKCRTFCLSNTSETARSAPRTAPVLPERKFAAIWWEYGKKDERTYDSVITGPDSNHSQHICLHLSPRLLLDSDINTHLVFVIHFTTFAFCKANNGNVVLIILTLITFANITTLYNWSLVNSSYKSLQYIHFNDN